MLQFLLEPNGKYSLSETAQMAIEGGCKWIQIHCPEMNDADLRSEAAELIPLCRETATILMLEDRPELARELGLHGIHLRRHDIAPALVREDMGPEEIIGVEIASLQGALALNGLDIDYAAVSPSLDAEARHSLIASIREAGVELPLVAEGSFSIEAAKAEVRQFGASGVCTSHHIVDSADPVEYTSRMISALEN